MNGHEAASCRFAAGSRKGKAMADIIVPWETYTPSKAAWSFIKKQEGYRATVYQDGPSNRAGGWGHSTSLPVGKKMPRAFWDTCFARDMTAVENCIRRNVKVGLTQDQVDALASLIFNIGCAAFAASTLLKRLNAGDISGASAEFERWKYDDGQVNVVLAVRRALEREIFDR
jgi:lysozyme